jgi:hypothetical protein
MFDRSKLSKIDWKYIVIDEAQRMKDRESVLARDLDRYRCQRRLLLTGTPLQVCYNSSLIHDGRYHLMHRDNVLPKIINKKNCSLYACLYDLDYP